ncbi:MAG: hypothetical protein IPL43_13025 [Micropruina sp.]|nr:hypothetical protein [Micropruina sp.]
MPTKAARRSLSELWAVPINLRIILIENVRRVSESIVIAAQHRREADQVADRLLGMDGSTPETLDAVLPDRAGFHPGRAYAVQLIRRLTHQPAEQALAWVHAELLAQGLDPEDAIQEEHQTQARTTVTMHNIFRSLRTLTDVNWEDWLESVSLIEAELRANPVYSALDFTTRNLYRSAIERLARGARQDEIVVTRAAVALARTAPTDLSRDVGYWLLDNGSAEFERSLGYRAPLREKFARLVRKSGLPGYAVALTLVTTALLVLGLWPVVALSGELAPGWVILLAALAAVPTTEVALGLVNQRVMRILRAAPLPALALRDGVTQEFRTLVVVPTMLSSLDWVEELIGALEVHFHANNDGEVYFAAVTDWEDSPTEHRDDDEALLLAAQAGIRELNQRPRISFFLSSTAAVDTTRPGRRGWLGTQTRRLRS